MLDCPSAAGKEKVRVCGELLLTWLFFAIPDLNQAVSWVELNLEVFVSMLATGIVTVAPGTWEWPFLAARPNSFLARG